MAFVVQGISRAQNQQNDSRHRSTWLLSSMQKHVYALKIRTLSSSLAPGLLKIPALDITTGRRKQVLYVTIMYQN